MNNELYHHGVLGQKWGVRRYQNKDGTLTAAGRKKLTKIRNKESYRVSKNSGSSSSEMKLLKANNKAIRTVNRIYEKRGFDTSKSLNNFNVSRKALKKKINRSRVKVSMATYDAEKRRRTAEAEIKRINKMSLNDFSKERKDIGKKYVKSLFTEYLPGIKTDLRVDKKEKDRIEKKSMNEARKAYNDPNYWEKRGVKNVKK